MILYVRILQSWIFFQSCSDGGVIVCNLSIDVNKVPGGRLPAMTLIRDLARRNLRNNREEEITSIAFSCLAGTSSQHQHVLHHGSATTRRADEKALESISVIITSGVALMGARFYLTGAEAPEFAAADNPASQAESVLTRTLTFFYLPAFNFWLLLCPRWLSFDWSMDAVPLVESVFDVRVYLAVFFYLGLGHLFWKFNRQLFTLPDW
jgi:hypothetical protein